MKTLALIVAGSLAGSTIALAQSTVRGNASAQSQAAVSADRRGASLESGNRAQGGAAAGEQGASDGQAADLGGASEMNATLERSVDARRAKPGDEIIAKTNEELVTQGGLTMPRGTKLVGRVTEARPRARGEGAASAGTASQLGIVFDKAVLKDGREIPMNATIQAVAAARSEVQPRVGSASNGPGAGGASRAAGSGAGRLGGGLGGLAGGVAAGAGGTLEGAARLPSAGAGAVAGGVAAQGGAVLGSSAGAAGGLSSSGRWLAGSRGVFGLPDVHIASTAAGSARGSLLTSASRNVRLDGGTQLLLVGTAGAAR